MDTEKLHKLLEKYWSCETSVREEKELQFFFSEGNVPEELRQYIPLFSYIRDEQSITLSDDFSERLQNAIEAEAKQRYVTIRIFKPLLRIAVSVLLVVGMGISFYFISKQDNRPHFVETFEDPNAAMRQATYALEKLSHALRKSETVSMETIHFIDDLDIDWTAIDSLNNNNPVETDSVKSER
ncbi:hypothetical protein [Proteiniphilum sp. X52]|uniref:hypothetical protein n=1 Tax=Proteiniphilum sp. X52 TaxID=2382159 RepID=UPI000F0A0325|nr:hypothetical protein [Proteiniphilum sp. X52]RNC67056.1 hypothetical protein D7D25_02170 [Proteiniphilum sp. X52]